MSNSLKNGTRIVVEYPDRSVERKVTYITSKKRRKLLGFGIAAWSDGSALLSYIVFERERWRVNVNWLQEFNKISKLKK